MIKWPSTKSVKSTPYGKMFSEGDFEYLSWKIAGDIAQIT